MNSKEESNDEDESSVQSSFTTSDPFEALTDLDDIINEDVTTTTTSSTSPWSTMASE